MNRIYLDYNASAPCREEVLDRMAEVARSHFGNPSSAHKEGRAAKAVVEEAREQTASAIGARPTEIVFTSGGTESDNLAIHGALAATPMAQPHVVTSAIEHPAVLMACRKLEARGLRLSVVPCDDMARIDPEVLRTALEEDTALVSVMHANNEVGSIQPVQAIARLAHDRKALVHADAVQSLGKIPVDVNDLGVDLLSISGHKIGGPKGAGALYIREGTAIESILHGGHQEFDQRPGTENVAAIAGCGVAVQLAVRAQAAESARLGRLKTMLWEGLCGEAGGVVLNGSFDGSVTNTLNVSFDGVDAEAAMIALDLEGVAVSTGSACAVGAVEPSHVLEAMCFERERCRGALRFSMGFRTTEAEIREALEVIARVIRRLRHC